MWRKLKNFFLSLRTYSDMSPDVGLRRRINQTLRSRSSRSFEEWYHSFWKRLDVSKDVAAFVYDQMEEYSGLQFSRVLPSDRLSTDLHLSMVCWFDWECTLCDDFCDRFSVDIHGCFDPYALSTIKDLVVFLNQQVIPVNYSQP
ncbi:hypothetical protein [Myxacorys almedinensis]|uniref:Uncharacterized protein n=1 Tax=Myxacorys almedinensis A TaxID=2690445 RepID=A0A8J7YZ81_9CYAN|nr:hypothetical protein [Myxacorys almedinensis]NDJ17264.1 hypothetical protein [Myxacorys almedinensis A]